MKKLTVCIAVFIIACTLWATIGAMSAGAGSGFQNITVTASPSTANATYIIETDNFTIQLGDNITVTDFGNIMTATATTLGESLGSEYSDLVASILAFLIMAAITILAFWQRNVFLYMLACPVDLVYGLTFAANNDVNSAAWVGGIIVAIIGTFCLFRVSIDAWPELKARLKRE